jgi:integrase/recombinase XerD
LASPWAAITEPLPESLSKTLPVALSRAEVLHFLGSVEDIEHQAILTTCYAAGLRISKAVRLKTSSLDNQRIVIRVAQVSLIVEPSAYYLAL